MWAMFSIVIIFLLILSVCLPSVGVHIYFSAGLIYIYSDFLKSQNLFFIYIGPYWFKSDFTKELINTVFCLWSLEKSVVFLQTVNLRHNTVIRIILLTVNKKQKGKKQWTTQDYMKLLSTYYNRTQNTEYITWQRCTVNKRQIWRKIQRQRQCACVTLQVYAQGTCRNKLHR